MKKKIILIIAICVVLISLICIPKSTYQKLFSKNKIETPIVENKDFLVMYVVNEEKKVVGVNVYLDEIEDDVIRQKWNILTSNLNILPEGYSSPITPSTVLNEYTVEDNKLILNVSEEIKRSSGRLTIESLAWNFCNEKISEVVLVVDNKVLTNINDCNFSKISKTIGVNYDFETSYLFEADNITIVHYSNEIIYPVTYFYNKKDQCEYMISKIFDFNEIEFSNYSYELSNGGLNIIFDEEIDLNDDVKDSIVETVRLNFDVDMINVSNINKTIIEQTFVEVDNIE